MFSDYPTAFLKTCGLDVGLPKGQMGNSEVGHLNLGAGRIVNQDIVRIDAALESGKIAMDPTITKLISDVNEKNSTCHLMGLISTGGVHSHQNQIAALATVLNEAGVRVIIHTFLDGRDTPPKSAKEHMRQFMSDIKKLENVSGQNPIDAAKLGCKIYHGSYVYNFQEIYDILKTKGVTKLIKNSDELAENLIKDLENPIKNDENYSENYSAATSQENISNVSNISQKDRQSVV